MVMVLAQVADLEMQLDLMDSLLADQQQRLGWLEADFLGQPAPLLAVPSIGSRYYLDLGVSYDFDDWLSIRFAIDNLTDTDAPLMPGVNNNTDAPLYDVYGRSYFLMLSTRIFGD